MDYLVYLLALASGTLGEARELALKLSKIDQDFPLDVLEKITSLQQLAAHVSTETSTCNLSKQRPVGCGSVLADGVSATDQYPTAPNSN
jgi:hypothetical protein